MNRNQFAQICGALASVLLIPAAILYAINSPHRFLATIAFWAGLGVLALFIALNAAVIRSFFGKRSAKYGANMLVMVILFICIIAVIQALSVRHNRRFDLTSNARFSLASQTINVLRGLADDVSITAFYQKSGQDRMKAQDLLEEYAYRSAKLHYEMIDPDRRPQLAKSMGVTNYGTTVVERGDRKELITDLNEETLTNAILKVSKDDVKVIYFLQGHGEKDPAATEKSGYSIFKQALEQEGYDARILSLFEEEAVPDDASILIVAGPARDLFESETDKIMTYLARGRNAIFMLDPFIELPNVEALLTKYGLAVDNDIVIDPFSRMFGGEYTIPVVTQYVEHPITKGFSIATFYPLARSVRMTGEPGDFETQYLAQTGKSAWGEMDLETYREGTAVRDDEDVPAPVPLVAISYRDLHAIGNGTATPPEDIRSNLVLIGDSDCVANASYHVLGNADFFMNTVNYLAEEKDLIAIRAKQGLGDRLFLTASQGRLIFLLSVVLLPLAIMTFGSALFLKRRRRG